MGVGAAIVVFSVNDDLVFELSSAFSASGSYPSRSIRSASSFAFFSAASKSISSPVTCFAPNFWPLLAPRMFAFLGPAVVGPFRIADAEVPLMTAGGGAVFSELSAEASGDGDLGRPAADAPFWFAERKGDAVRDTMGGVPVLEGGLLGRFIVGLSHEEKKSSLGSPPGVAVASEAAATSSSVRTTSPG
jgi:hypothetical protein